MKIIQKLDPRIYNNTSITYEDCCEAASANHMRPLLNREPFLTTDSNHELNENDLRIKYCPYCGTKIEIIIVWPTKHEIKKLVEELYHTYGLYLVEEEDFNLELFSSNQNEDWVEEYAADRLL